MIKILCGKILQLNAMLRECFVDTALEKSICLESEEYKPAAKPDDQDLSIRARKTR